MGGSPPTFQTEEELLIGKTICAVKEEYDGEVAYYNLIFTDGTCAVFSAEREISLWWKALTPPPPPQPGAKTG